MALLKIAQIGHPILRRRANEVDPADITRPRIQACIDDLIETMRDANGAGLAANQVYRLVRIVVLEVANNPRYPYKPGLPLTVLVNPVVQPLTTETFDNYEGCLSVPNLRGLAPRFLEVRVTGFDREGNAYDQTFKGLSAGTFQHECDHLDGILFLDRVKDTKTIATGTEWERHHRKAFLESIAPLVKEAAAE